MEICRRMTQVGGVVASAGSYPADTSSNLVPATI